MDQQLVRPSPSASPAPSSEHQSSDAIDTPPKMLPFKATADVLPTRQLRPAVSAISCMSVESLLVSSPRSSPVPQGSPSTTTSVDIGVPLDASSGEDQSQKLPARNSLSRHDVADEKPPIFDAPSVQQEVVQNDVPKRERALPTPPSPPKQQSFNRFAAFQPDLPASESEQEEVDYETEETMLQEQQELLRQQKLKKNFLNFRV